MKNAYDVILRPRITERSVKLSYGDPRKEAEAVVRQYTFEVHVDANKIEIAQAIETIYNVGRKDGEKVSVDKVRTIRMKGKTKRVGQRKPGSRPQWKKAIVTLGKGQILEDFGV